MDEGNSAESADAKAAAAGNIGRPRARAGPDEHVRANVGKDDGKACNGARRSRSVGCRSPAIQGDSTKASADNGRKDNGTRRMRGTKVGVGGRADAITSNLVQHPPTVGVTHRESASAAGDLRRWDMLAKPLSTHQFKGLSVRVSLRLAPSSALLPSLHN